MNIKNGIPYVVFIKQSEAGPLQNKYHYFYCDCNGRTQLVFSSRHFADKFARDVLHLSGNEYGVSVVFSENWNKELGFQINIMSVPSVIFSEEGG